MAELASRRTFALGSVAMSALGFHTLALGQASGAQAATRATSVAADHRRISYEGRVDRRGDGRVRLGFGGVHVRMNLRASQVSLLVEMQGQAGYLDISVNGGPHQMLALKPGIQSVLLGNQGEPVNQLEIVGRAESWVGVVDLISLDLGPRGKLLSPPRLPGKRLMFIGDSITAGYGTDVTGVDDPRANDPLTHNGRLTYGRMLARMLNAQAHLVAFSGKGLIRDWQGLTTEPVASEFFERSNAVDAQSRWDHRTWVPDGVGICLGTNDFAQGIPDEPAFTNAAERLIFRVLQTAPKARIVLIQSPMLRNEALPRRTRHGEIIQGLATRLADRGVAFAPMPILPGRPVDAHPIASEQRQMAELLRPYFEKA